jgi:hypothetical protein
VRTYTRGVTRIMRVPRIKVAAVVGPTAAALDSCNTKG